MSKRKTREQFISDAIAVHGYKYDYSKIKYVNALTEVCIICPIHGEFFQSPNTHLSNHGCIKCAYESLKTPIFNIGINDLSYSKRTAAYRAWIQMLRRCYNKKEHSNHNKTYSDCSVVNTWLLFSNFKKWFENPNNGYISGYHLDKDILVKGNKIYSPETCCFVPSKINSLFTKRAADRGLYPIGVTKVKSGRYWARLGERRLGLGVFDTPEEAFNAYKIAKEQHIKELADKYFKEGKITQRVHDALMKYEVEITD